jgi:diketogulonate reductase-like aldo/keto reductase
MAPVTLISGTKMPRLGLGTWRMGERKSLQAEEAAAIALGLDLGIKLIDTAEMYGEGGAESMLATAIAGRRDRLTLVSKVYPHNASRKGTLAACERSLKRLNTDWLDVYLLHWRGRHPLAETLEAFEALKRQGKIRAWGVSNFDADAMRELLCLAGGNACAVNQVLYSLGDRGIEWDLLPLCRRAGVAVMAYAPLGQGSLLRSAALRDIAKKHAVAPAAVALAWVMRQRRVVAIFKASRPEHVRADVKALSLTLDAQDLAALESAFPPPRHAQPLEVL